MGDHPRYFKRLLYGFDPAPTLAVLAEHPELWDLFTARQEVPGSAHHDTRCIVLLGPQEVTVDSWFSDLEAVPWHAFHLLAPHLAPAIAALAQATGTQGGDKLGRVMLAELKPGGEIDPHTDEGPYSDHYQRFHIVLASEPGNLFRCGDEVTWMQPGEVWWFNHKAVHRVANGSTEPRIHVIVDMATPNPSAVAEAIH